MLTIDIPDHKGKLNSNKTQEVGCMTISHHDEICKRDKEYRAENYMEKCIKWANDTIANDYIKRCRTNNDKSLYDFCEDDCRRIRIPDHDGILCGYFDNDLQRWMYEPDIDFIKCKYPLSNSENERIICYIKAILELKLEAYTNKKVTIDVKVCMNHGGTEHSYSYIVSFE